MFCRLLIFIKINFLEKKSFKNIIRVSNSLDPDQARRFSGPVLGPNGLEILSVDDTSRKIRWKMQSVQIATCRWNTPDLVNINVFIGSF